MQVLCPEDCSLELCGPAYRLRPIRLLNSHLQVRPASPTLARDPAIVSKRNTGCPKGAVKDASISAATGLKAYHAKGIQFIDSKVNVESGQKLTLFNAEVSGLE